jgi:hypothetical protein
VEYVFSDVLIKTTLVSEMVMSLKLGCVELDRYNVHIYVASYFH